MIRRSVKLSSVQIEEMHHNAVTKENWLIFHVNSTALIVLKLISMYVLVKWVCLWMCGFLEDVYVGEGMRVKAVNGVADTALEG